MTTSAAPSSVKRSRKWRRRIVKTSIILLLAIIGFAVTAPMTVGWIIGRKLKSELATRMNATLDFQRVLYAYPYGVKIEKAHLIIPGADGVDSWFEVSRLELTLAKIPLGSGPALIKKLKIENPTVHLASDFKTAPSPTAATAAAAPAPTGPVQKLSDLFQLQNVIVSNARFEYDFSVKGHSIPPVIWGHVDADMATLPTSGSTYKFNVAIADQPLATANATGSFDIDALQLNVDKVTIAMACDPAVHAEQIPPQGWDIIQKYRIAGKVSIDGTASVPLQSIDQTTFTSVIDLQNLSCQPPGFAGPITPTRCTIVSSKSNGPATVDFSAQDSAGTIRSVATLDLNSLLLDVQKLAIDLKADPAHPITQLPRSATDAMAKLKTGGEVTFDCIARVPLQTPMKGWYAAKLALKDGQVQLADWKGPVSPAKFTITTSNVPDATAENLPTSLPNNLPDHKPEAHLWVNGLSASCGNQIFKIDGGEVVFNPADNTWTLRKFHGVGDVGDGPGPLDGANTRLYIPFIASGNGKLGDPASSIRIALDDGSVVTTANHIHLNRINGMLTATPNGLRSSGVTAICANGQAKIIVNADWKPPQNGPPLALAYDGEIHIKQIDLHQLALEYTTDPAVRQQAFGQLDFNVKYNGSILKNSPPTGTDSIADRFYAQGDFDITHGYFLDIPVLRDLLIAMGNPAGSTVGEAAAVFNASHSVVNLDHTGASSPVLGIQGSGTIGFDQKIDMVFVATPLADWAKDVKGAGFISDAGAAIVGKIQDAVNNAQKGLYQLRVTGNLTPKPDVTPVAIPFLSDKMTPLFQKMAGGNQQPGNMADDLKKQQEQDKK
jgi:hypothetical protein